MINDEKIGKTIKSCDQLKVTDELNEITSCGRMEDRLKTENTYSLLNTLQYLS